MTTKEFAVLLDGRNLLRICRETRLQTGKQKRMMEIDTKRIK